ncbi:MAG: hypothetical protein D6681_22945 [Calditrichaeota bacterium]|nr:MAG: hypothetical protein D6681_22945 [Calditrichota bacterium]
MLDAGLPRPQIGVVAKRKSRDLVFFQGLFDGFPYMVSDFLVKESSARLVFFQGLFDGFPLSF